MLEHAIDRLFADWQQDGVPGGAVAVLHEGRLVHRRGYGLADLESSLPFPTAAPFPIASVTKQITAACVLMLEERGAVRLDDDIRELLPELGDLGAPLTIEHLLRHTSGLRDYITLGTFAGGRLLEGLSEDVVRRLIVGQRTLNFAPGTRSCYSNTNYVLLSWIIERITGAGLGAAFADMVFAPLGMDSTSLVEDPMNGPATPIRGHVGSAPLGFRRWHWTAHSTGEGGVWSTLDDLVLWMGNLDRPRIGSPRLFGSMMSRRPLADGSANEFGMGFKLGEHLGHRWAGHSGGFDGYRSQILWFPDHRLGVVVLANQTVDPTDAALAVADVVLSRIDGSAGREQRLAGSYRSSELDAVCEVAVPDPGQLVLSVTGPAGAIEGVVLQRCGDDRYKPARASRAAWNLEFDTDFRFEIDDAGRCVALIMDCEWARGNRFERVAATP